jgi:hypothetical protein
MVNGNNISTEDNGRSIVVDQVVEPDYDVNSCAKKIIFILE